MRQRRWIELLSDYDCELKYHPSKANVVADALSRKERLRPSRVRALGMLVQMSLKSCILDAQKNAMKDENLEDELLSGVDHKLETWSDGVRYLNKRAWIPKINNLRRLLWMKLIDRDILSIQELTRFKAEHQKPPGLLQQPKILVWKWEEIMMDFVTSLPRITKGHDLLWVVLDQLTDSHFTSQFWRLLQDALGTRLDTSTTYHSQTDSQSERTIQMMEDMLRVCVINLGVTCLWSPLCWLEMGDKQLIRLDIIEETVDKITTIKERLRTARSRQKSYADNHRKPLEFQIKDNVLLKVSPWKGMIRFGK
ncbi:hypothetical protein Tco_0838261 [Tanacetum coccineum]|uniref:Reverse transcriptase domain-containing protein n=1 Tax=Tanacetum coccineum TaxID=301880 RepID=A0ABQ5AP22_9ASTR